MGTSNFITSINFRTHSPLIRQRTGKCLLGANQPLFTIIAYLLNVLSITETGKMLINTVKFCIDSLNLQNLELP